MADLIRPGPPFILPGQAPGGFVLHVYSQATNELLATTPLMPPDMTSEVVMDEHASAFTRQFMGVPGAVVLVIYDGDTGERTVPEGYQAGDRLM